MRAFLARITSLFDRSRGECDLSAELESHLQLHIDDNLRAGMNPAEARRQALLKLGGMDSVKENWRDRRGFPALEHLVRDLHYALRMAARNPGFTAVIVLSLALGIGANTAIFSVTDALLLKSLPVEKPDQLVVFAGWDSAIHQWMYNFTWREFEELRRRTRSFSGLATTWAVDRANVIANGQVDEGQTHIGIVSGNYLSLLGIVPAMGRSFSENEAAVVISYGYWERRFGSAPDVLGRAVRMNGRVLTIAGVAPRRFTGDSVGQPMDLWIPASIASQAITQWSQSLSNDRVRVIARLRPGVTAAQAEAEAKTVYRQIARDIGRAASQSPDRVALLPEGQGISRPREHYRQPLLALTFVAGLVLLIACANAANLLLTRSEARRKEMAVRLALGAGRGRIVRQLLLESAVLAALSGAAGMALARWGTGGLVQLARTGPWAVDLNLATDGRMLAYTAGLCLLTGVLFGLAPALAASKAELYTAVKSASNGPVRFRLGKFLVVAQVGLSLILLMGAGLFVRTLRNLKSQDLGFERERLLLVRTDPSPGGRKTSATEDAYEQIGRLAGVRSVSAAHFGMLRLSLFTTVTVPDGVARTEADRTVAVDQIAPRYLETIGMRLLAGREFTAHDMTLPPRVAIVNESMARRFFGRMDVVGSGFIWGDDPAGPSIEIVGVVKDAAYNRLRERNAVMFYMPEGPDWRDVSDASLVVRTTGQFPGIAGRIREELRAIAPGVTIRSVDWVDVAMDQSLAIERMVAWIAGLFGVLALLLACLGLYGMMSYVAARRTSEIGIRVSLGATPAQVIRMVVGEALGLGLAGAAVGIPAALAGGRLVAGLLFGIRGADGATLAGATLLLLAVVALAAIRPAWRAAKVDAMQALRCE